MTGVLAILVVTLPLLVARASSAVSAATGSALAEPAVARLVLAGLALPAAAGGVALVATLGRPSAAAVAVVAAPVQRLDRVVAIALLPVVTVVVGALPTAAAIAVPLAQASAAGLTVLPALLGVLVVAVAAGGCLVPSSRIAFARRVAVRDRAVAVALAAALGGCLWVAVVAAARATASGGAAPIVVAVGAASAGAMSFAAALEWLLEAGVTTGGRRRRSWRLPLTVRRATVIAGIALLIRRREVRAALGGALVVGVAGLVLGRLAATPPPAGALVALGGALVVLAPVGLAVSGVLVDGRSLWGVVPARRPDVASALAGASAAITAAAGASVLAAAVIGGEATAADAAPLGALVLAAWLTAFTAGAIVPWARAGAGGQAASLGAFGVVAGVSAICAGRLAELVPTGGPQAVGAWCAVGVTATTLAVGGHARLAGGTA